MAKKWIFCVSIITILVNCLIVYAGTIDRAFWDKLYTKYYQQRNMVAQTSGFPDGTPMTFEVWEDDSPGDSDDFMGSVPGTIKNNLAIASWEGGNGDDWWDYAEYYLRAKVGGVSLSSSNQDFKGNGGIGHNQWDDCDFDSDCANLLYCEGVPWYTGGSGGASGDGCCYDYENWNIDSHYCNYAIKGQVFNVISNQDGTFSSSYFSNIPIFFKVYDQTSIIGRLIELTFFDMVMTDNKGNYYYSPEFNRENLWNTNIAFNWNVDVFALDNNNKLIAKWTNSYSSNLEKYIRGNDYVDQIVRIHTDKQYWRTYPSSSVFSKSFYVSSSSASPSSSSTVLSQEESPISLDIVKKIVAKEIKIQTIEPNENILSNETNEPISTLSTWSNPEEDNQKKEEVLYFNWSGVLIVSQESEYSFNTTIQGGYKLTINNIVIHDSLFSDDSKINSIYLGKGRNNLSIEYITMIDREAPNLLWRTDTNEDFEVIPKENLKKVSFTYQFYNVDQKLNIIMFEKFETSDQKIKLLSTTSSPDHKLFQVSFLEAPRKPLNPNKEPIILVHGLHGESGYFDGTFEDSLNAKGYDVWKFYYPGDQKVLESSVLLSDLIQYLLSKMYSVSKINLITHSMGGLVARGYVENLAQDVNGKKAKYMNNTHNLIMLAPPSYGSYLANRIKRGEDLGTGCGGVPNIIGWFFFGKAFNDWNILEPAYEDLMIGSNLSWILNKNTINSDIDSIVITGNGNDFNFVDPCIPLEDFDDDYLVSLTSASLLPYNVSLILMNKNHLTIYKQLGRDVALWEIIFNDILSYIIPYPFNIANQLYALYLKIIDFLNSYTDLSDVIGTIDYFIKGNNLKAYLDSGEFFIDKNDHTSDSNNYQKGSILLKFGNLTPSSVDLHSNFKINNKFYNFSLVKNQYSNIWYHFQEYSASDPDYGLSLPIGSYSLIVNELNTSVDIEIKPLEFTLYEYIDSDGDGTVDEDDSCLTTPGTYCHGCPQPTCAICNQSYCPALGQPYCINSLPTTQCGIDYLEYSCPWGNDIDDDTGKRLHDFHCDGIGSCLDDTQNWQVDEECTDYQYCYYDSLGNDDEDYYCKDVVTIDSPTNNSKYNTRYIYLAINSEKMMEKLEYSLNEGRYRSLNLGKNKNQYFDEINVRKDGNHTLIIRITYPEEIIITKTINFFTDSTKPKIIKTKPTRGYANGTFSITYTEENCKSLALSISSPTHSLGGGWPCDSGKNLKRQIIQNLSSFDGEIISYAFNITDIANNSASKTVKNIKVDTTPPIITYFNYSLSGRYVTFNMTITEKNFDSVDYIDWKERSPRHRVLCSRLDKNNNCIKKLSFSRGFHNLTLNAIDEVGNQEKRDINFIISY